MHNRVILIVLGLVALLLPGCRGSYQTQFDVVAADTGEPISGARIRVEYPHRTGPDARRSRSLVTDEEGHAQARLTRWPFLDVQVDHPGYQIARLGAGEEPLPWDVRAQQIVRENLPGQAQPGTRASVRPPRSLIESGAARFDFALELDTRPTVQVMLPGDFRGLVLLERQPGLAQLPDPPTPRVFQVQVGASGTATAPAWPSGEAPFVNYRVYRDAAPLARFAQGTGTVYAHVVRRFEDVVLIFVGSERDELAMRRILWEVDPLEHRLLWRPYVFEETKRVLREAESPVTPWVLAAALEITVADPPSPTGGPAMDY